MIPTTAQLTVEISKLDWQAQEKSRWLKEREKAYNYYKGRTKPYTLKFFSTAQKKKVACPITRLTRRVIDRISLVYMNPPQREYSNEKIIDLFYNKDFKMQRAEKLCNLLEVILIKPTWRKGRIEYDILKDWEPLFFEDDDPLYPSAITYPLSIKSSISDTTPELWAYWDSEHHFIYEKGTGRKLVAEDNPDMINPYSMLPFVECYRDGKPEAGYFDTDASPELIQANEIINNAYFNMGANINFQSFAYLTLNGTNLEKERLEVGPDKISYLGHDGTLSMVAPPNSVPALSEAIKDQYRMLAQDYHISVAFVEGTTAESGVALKLRNSELMDSRKSDVIRWREIENKIFEIEERIINVEIGKEAGFLLNIDYQESVEILSEQEKREKWEWELKHNITDLPHILMEKYPDKYPDIETAKEFLLKLETNKSSEETSNNPLLEALTTPV